MEMAHLYLRKAYNLREGQLCTRKRNGGRWPLSVFSCILLFQLLKDVHDNSDLPTP